MNERLKQLRSSLKINQKDFSQQINVGQSTYAMFESGQRKIKDIHISQICQTFNVSEEWLRNGTGEMFIKKDSSILSALAAQHNLSGVELSILSTFLNLNEQNRSVILEFVKSTMAAVITNNYEDISPYIAKAQQSAVQSVDDMDELYKRLESLVTPNKIKTEKTGN